MFREDMLENRKLFYTEGITQSYRNMHTPSEFARQNLLYVQEIGHLQSLQAHRCVRENVDSFLFFIVTEGKGYLNINKKESELHCGDGAFIDCREHYEHISDANAAWKLAWVHFNGKIAKKYHDLFFRRNNNSNIFSVKNIKEWDEILTHIQEKQKVNNFDSELICGELLLHMLNKIVFSVTYSEKDTRCLADEIREYVNSSFSNTCIEEDTKEHFKLNFTELNDLFTKKIGIGIREYVDNRRLNYAKELLRFSIKPIEAIAELVGIGDVERLQQLFLQKENLTAEAYRMKWGQWIK